MIRLRGFHSARMASRHWRARLLPCGVRFFEHHGWRQCCLIYVRAGWRYWSMQIEVSAK